ncbi:MAG: HEAT repeat domain-containing protein [Gemmataceae bacterium]
MPRPALLLLLLALGCGQPAPPYEGKTLAELQQMVESSDSAKQVQGAFGLAKLGGEAAPAVPALRKALGSKDALVKQNAALALAKIGSPAREAIPELIGLLDDPAWQVRRQAALTLGALQAGQALPDLERLASDGDEQVRAAARQASAQIQQAP